MTISTPGREILLREVRAADLDDLGHLRMEVYVAWTRLAVDAWLLGAGLSPTALAPWSVGFVAAELHVRYLREMRLGERCGISVDCVRLQRRAMDLVSRIELLPAGDAVAMISQRILCLSVETRKAAEIPQAVRNRVPLTSMQDRPPS